MSPRRISIVPHTHWDREWYEPFQTFRLRLVHLIDNLLVLLESDPSYSRYLLDGQGFSERPHRFEQRDAGRGHV